MTIYLVVWIFQIAIFLVLSEQLSMKQAKMFFVAIMTSVYVLLSGLRHISVGADTLQYKVAKWDDILSRPWEQLWENWWLFTTHGYRYRTADGYNVEEPLYALFQKFCQLFTTNYQVYLIIVAVVFIVPMSILIYRYSEDPFISYTVFFCLFFNFFGITGICQTIATAMTAFGGFGLLKRKKWLRYVIVVILASFVHKSAFLALLLLPIAQKKITELYCMLVLGAFVMVFSLQFFFLQTIFPALGYSQYADEPFRGYNFLIIYLCIVLLLCWKHKSIEDSPFKRLCYNAVFLGLSITSIGHIGIRSAQYFTIYLIFALPTLLESLFRRSREKCLIKVIVTSGMILLSFVNAYPYKFFWQ